MTTVTRTDNKAIAAELSLLIDRLPDVDESTRDRIITDVVEKLYPHFKKWTTTFCRVSGDVHGNHRDDVSSLVAERVLVVLREVSGGEKHTGVDNWYSYLYAVSRYAALAYFNSSKVTAASGMTALLRKQRHIARIRSQLRSTLGREPEAQEVVDAANADMRARRSNPEKQGALVDLSDMEAILPAVDVENHDRAVEHNDDQALLAPVEGRELVGLIIQACSRVSPELGTAAQVWLGGMYSEPPSLGTSTDVAAELHINTSKASRLITSARDLAKELCNRRFGISFPV